MIRKILFIPFLVLLVFSSFAQNFQRKGSTLNVFSNNEPFFLILNGVRYNDNPLTEIRLIDLPDQLFDVQIEFNSQFRSVADLPRFNVYNEIGQALEITLLAQTSRRDGNSLIVYSLFPIQDYVPAIKNFPVFSYKRNKGSHSNRPPQVVDNRMNDVDFQVFLGYVKKESLDREKMNVTQLAMRGSLLSVSQIEQVAKSFVWDDGKLQFVEYMYDFCWDRDQYLNLLNVFTYSTTQDKFKVFLKRQFENNRFIKPMNSLQFDDFMKLLKKESFDNNKTDFLRVISNSTGFNLDQVRAIIKIYSFDDGKLAAAKLLFPNCVNKDRFYTLSDEFTFSSGKNNFQKFLLEK